MKRREIVPVTEPVPLQGRLRPADEIDNVKPMLGMKKRHEETKDATNGRSGTAWGRESLPLSRLVKPIEIFALSISSAGLIGPLHFSLADSCYQLAWEATLQLIVVSRSVNPQRPSFKNDRPLFTWPPLGRQQREPRSNGAQTHRRYPTSKDLLLLVSPSLRVRASRLPRDDRLLYANTHENVHFRFRLRFLRHEQKICCKNEF